MTRPVDLLPRPGLVQSRSRHRRGFSLVVTVAILVLLSLVAISVLTLSSSTIRSARSDAYQGEARANARLALMLAIGELQKELGPDQRISARASILDDDTESPGPDGVSQSHWLGTWDSWTDWLNNPDIKRTYQPGRPGRFRRWLVSHPDPAALEDLSRAEDSSLPDPVMMVGELPTSTAGEPTGAVEVPSVELTGNGRLAWWITGENQKARVAPTSPEPENDAQRLHRRSHWPQARVNWLEGLEDADPAAEVNDRAVSLPTYGLALDVPGSDSEMRARYHDLTVDSVGLPANVRHGGLKKDLNLLLELQRLPTQFGTYSARRFDGQIVPLRPYDEHIPRPFYEQNLNFPSWYKLHQYYQLYRGGGDETAEDCSPVIFRGSGLWGSPQAPNINFNWHRQNLDYFGIGRTPLVTRLMLVFSTRRVRSADGRNYDYKLGVNPVVVVWNPYNVKLHSPRLWIRITPGALQYKAYVNQRVKVPWTTLRRSDGPFNINIYPMAGPGRTTTPIVLNPGETRIFSAVRGFVNSQDFRNVELYPGYQSPEQRGGFEVTLEGLNQLPGSSQVELAMRLSDQRAHHAGQYQIYWTVRNAETGESQRYNELAANPVEDGKPIYLAEDAPGRRVRFSNSPNRVPFANFQFIMKSGQDLRNPGRDYESHDFRCRNFIHANPVNQRAMYGEATDRMRGFAQYHVQIQAGSGNSLNPDFEPSSNRAYLGSAISPGDSVWPGQTNFVASEFPLVPVTSIASLMHFKLNPGDTRTFVTGRHLWDVSANQALGIGNSFAHPLIPGDDIYHDVPDAACRGNPLQMKFVRDFHDHAFLSNDVLWDDWFCSGITREDEGLFKTGRDMRTVVEEFATGEAPLQNPHLVPWLESIPPEEHLHERLVARSTPASEAYQIVARYLMVKGAFNINSTSVEAWKAFLAGPQDEEIDYIDHESGRVRATRPPEDRVVFSRYSLPASPDEGTNAGDPASWLGIRLLTPEQIDRLARECVRQVKERGPFLNLSEFVNRRLTDDETGVCGALQAAIDWDETLGRTPQSSEEESINGRFKAGDDYIGRAAIGNWGLPFPRAAVGSRYAGIPGYLTQADLLKRIGNMITPRDDTFRIRGYGEARDASGNVRARSWCEAVVQRVPEYLESSDPPETAAGLLESEINMSFGRQFRIVSFRWLAPKEV